MTKISLQKNTTNVRESNKQPIKQVVKEPAPSVLESETQSEYVRASECTRIMDQAADIVMNLKEELYEKEKKLMAFDKIVRELAEKNKNINGEVSKLKQENDHYKNKNNVKINSKISEHKLVGYFDKDNRKIKNISIDDVDDTVIHLRKYYSC